MITKKISYCLLFLCVSIQACSEDRLSREDEIRLFIKQGVEAAEERSASDLSDMIVDSYRDQKGLGKQQIVKLLRAYFFRHKNIFLLTRIREIRFPTESDATVVLHVAMAGSVISDASVLTGLRARIYRFELQLTKRDEWLLKFAKWRQVSASDMQ